MLIGIGIQVLLDSIAQGVLIGEGIQQKWNWKETGLQVAVGALGGAMGLGSIRSSTGLLASCPAS